MVQRASSYATVPQENYATPSWVVDALFKYEDFVTPIWEPAAGDGFMVEALQAHSTNIIATSDNFFDLEHDAFSIITNPPFSKAEDFCYHALDNTVRLGGKVAMLLPVNFDTAKSRHRLFKGQPFKIKYILTERIRWANLEQKKNGPSTNHCWMVWDWSYRGEPRIWWI